MGVFILTIRSEDFKKCLRYHVNYVESQRHFFIVPINQHLIDRLACDEKKIREEVAVGRGFIIIVSA